LIPPFLLVIAGPNGAGKTTLISYILRHNVDFGMFISPDEIAPGIRAVDDEVRFRRAQREADALRENCIRQRMSFRTETVMSHPSKLELMQQAKANGFSVTLFFVGVDHPSISIARVRQRVAQGGHAVPEDRIVARYHRTMVLLAHAVLAADRGLIFDNSTPGDAPEQVGAGLYVAAEASLRRGSLFVTRRGQSRPWLEHYLIKPLQKRAQLHQLPPGVETISFE
jgi:predicted ABC-type ATPase